MITLTEDYNFHDLHEASFFGATVFMNRIVRLGLQDEFMEHLASTGITSLDKLNDFIWFECDEWIVEREEK